MRVKDYVTVERAASLSRSDVGRLGTAIMFIVGVMVFTGARFGEVEQSYLLIAAAVTGAYMAMNIGANDVANAVGPLAGIVVALTAGQGGSQVAIPLWVMAIGALGISVGLALFGPKLIRTVGSEITELDRSRAFCIALSAAITVIVASQLGMLIRVEDQHRCLCDANGGRWRSVGDAALELSEGFGLRVGRGELFVPRHSLHEGRL